MSKLNKGMIFGTVAGASIGAIITAKIITKQYNEDIEEYATKFNEQSDEIYNLRLELAHIKEQRDTAMEANEILHRGCSVSEYTEDTLDNYLDDVSLGDIPEEHDADEYEPAYEE